MKSFDYGRHYRQSFEYTLKMKSLDEMKTFAIGFSIGSALLFWGHLIFQLTRWKSHPSSSQTHRDAREKIITSFTTHAKRRASTGVVCTAKAVFSWSHIRTWCTHNAEKLSPNLIQIYWLHEIASKSTFAKKCKPSSPKDVSFPPFRTLRKN